MYRILFALTTLLTATLGVSQSLGLGVVVFDISSGNVVTFNHGLDSIWVDWDSDGSVFKTSFSTEIGAFEKQWTPSYLYFRLLDKRKDSLLIMFNEQRGYTLWVQKQERVKIMDWLSFLTNLDAVEIGWITELSTSPNDSAHTVPQKACRKFYIIQMKGNWIEVESICLFETNGQLNDRGWVKWTDGQKLLVNRCRNE